MRELARFAAVGGHQEDLVVAHEGQPRAVRRPARESGELAVLAERELDRRAAADVLPPEMEEETAGLPVGAALDVDERAPVWRELGIEQARKLREVDERQRPARLRAPEPSAFAIHTSLSAPEPSSGVGVR